MHGYIGTSEITSLLVDGIWHQVMLVEFDAESDTYNARFAHFEKNHSEYNDGELPPRVTFKASAVHGWKS